MNEKKVEDLIVGADNKVKPEPSVETLVYYPFTLTHRNGLSVQIGHLELQGKYKEAQQHKDKLELLVQLEIKKRLELLKSQQYEEVKRILTTIG